MSANVQPRTNVTALLRASPDGDERVLDQLVPLIYDELRAMARRQRGAPKAAPTLNTTALVHEAYLRLVDHAEVTARGRAYFFAAAAQAMRHVLVDRARWRATQKRGGGQAPISLDETQVAVETFAAELLDLDRALNELAVRHPRQARVVECRFFGGLTIEETAEALEISPRTVRNDWTVARARLHRMLQGNPEG